MIRRQCFILGRLRWDSLSSFAASLRPTLQLLAIGAVATPVLCFGLEILINSILFAAEDNNTLKLIFNRTAEVEFLDL